jgi:hypothetical protein
MAFAEINNLAGNLAAGRAGLSDSPWRTADLSLRPISNSRGTHRLLRLQVALGILRRFSLTAQLLHPGADRGEVVGSAGSVHGLSSLPLV